MSTRYLKRSDCSSNGQEVAPVLNDSSPPSSSPPGSPPSTSRFTIDGYNNYDDRMEMASALYSLSSTSRDSPQTSSEVQGFINQVEALQARRPESCEHFLNIMMDYREKRLYPDHVHFLNV